MSTNLSTGNILIFVSTTKKRNILLNAISIPLTPNLVGLVKDKVKFEDRLCGSHRDPGGTTKKLYSNNFSTTGLIFDFKMLLNRVNQELKICLGDNPLRNTPGTIEQIFFLSCDKCHGF